MYKKIGKMVYQAFFPSFRYGSLQCICDLHISSHLSDIRLEIIRGILTKYGAHRSTAIGRLSIRDSPLRLTARQFPVLIPQTLQSNQPRRKWVVCASHDIRSDTRYICLDCDAPLCIVDRFKDFHTKMDY